MLSNKIFYIDPMSYNNLSIYDYNLLTNLNSKDEIVYIGSNKYDYKNIDLLKLYRYNNKNGIFKVLSYLKTQCILFLKVCKEKPKVIHFQWFKMYTFDYWLIRIIKIFFNSKIIFTAHNILPHDSKNKYIRIFNKIYNLVDNIIVHTNTTKEDMQTMFNIAGPKITVIRHGILTLIDSCETKVYEDKYRKKFKQNDETIFAFLGTISEYKGINILVDAWKKSESLGNNPGIKLLIAGKPCEKEKKYSALNDYRNVIIDDRMLSNDEFSAYFNIADVIVLPYITISQSGLLLTAIVKNKPIIVTSLDGLTDPFQFGDLGWILEETSSASLMNILEYLSLNKEKIDRIKNDKQLWKKILKNYDWTEIGKKTVRLYEY